MAYRRYRTRRPVRRYARRGKGYYRNRLYARRRMGRGFGRRRRYQSKRITPYNRKHNVVRGAHETNDESFASIDSPNTFFLYCPSYLPNRVAGDDNANSQKVRESKYVKYTGYREKVHITTSAALIWRRIVIWSYNRIPNAVGPTKTDANGNTYDTRQITPLQNTEDWRTFIFRGTQGIDYTVDTLHEAPLNSDHFTVAYDRTRTLNPRRPGGDQFDFIHNAKFWNHGGKIIYSDDESGLTKGPETNGWSALGRESKGNLFILDIFSTGTSLTSNQSGVARYAPVGTKYWTEG